MPFIEVTSTTGNPVNIFYEDYGEGKPVVLIHGWPLSHEMWEYQLNALVSAGYRCIAYDRRGFGKSDKPWTGYDYDTLTGDLNALMESLDLQDATLVGFSMGGGEVARYFGKYGGARVSKAILLGSVTPLMLQTPDNEDGVPQKVFDEMAAEMKKDRIAFLDEFGKTFFGVSMLSHPVSTPLLEYYRMLASLASPKATLDCAEAFAQTNFLGDLAVMNVPTLIIHGDSDQTVPIEATGEKAATIVPDNQFIVYEGAPHGFFYTDRERLNADLIAFIG